MSETQYYKKYAEKLCAQVEAELRGELLDADNKTVENFHEFIARTSRRDLIAKITELVNEHINTVLIANELGKHFADADADRVKARKNVVPFDSFHNFLKKTPSVAKHPVIPAPISMTAGGGSAQVFKVIGLLAALQAAARAAE